MVDFSIAEETRQRVIVNDGEPQFEIIHGDDNFFDTPPTFTYNCEWNLLMNLVDHVKNGTDGSADMTKFLRSEGRLELTPSRYSGDNNGHIYSVLETAILDTNKFDGYVSPSKGTVVRLNKVSRAPPGGIMKFDAFLITPHSYPDCEDDERIEFDSYRDMLKDICCELSIEYREHLCTWQTLPKNYNLYFGSYGWKMHNYDVKGVGLELNPQVAAVTSLAMLNYEDNGDHYKLTYSKNNWTHHCEYYKVPRYYREHGADYLQRHSKRTYLAMSLFNVVSTKLSRYYDVVHETKDIRYAHSPGRGVVPKITGQFELEHNGSTYLLATSTNNEKCDVVDVLIPLEFSTRQRILRELGYIIPEYEGGPFSVLSTTGSVYVSFDIEDDNVVGVKFKDVELPFPTAWFHNGKKWVLRAYPKAVRLKEDEHGDIDINGFKFSKDDNGNWYLYRDGEWLYVPHSIYYNENLQCYFSIAVNGSIKKVFFRTGELTRIYYEHKDGVPMNVQARPKMLPEYKCVTLTHKYDGAGRKNEVRNACLALRYVEKGTTGTYYFDTYKDARTFFIENKKLYHNIWHGDLTHEYHFTDPMSASQCLVPFSYVFRGNSCYSFPLTLEHVFGLSDMHDIVGNFIGESSGENAYDVFELLDDLVDF